MTQQCEVAGWCHVPHSEVTRLGGASAGSRVFTQHDVRFHHLSSHCRQTERLSTAPTDCHDVSLCYIMEHVQSGLDGAVLKIGQTTLYSPIVPNQSNGVRAGTM